FFFSLPTPPPTPTLFPYTTLFRSHQRLIVVWRILNNESTRRRGTNDICAASNARRGLCGQRGIGSGRLHVFRLHARSLPRSIIKDRKSTRLNSSHVAISYAVFCLK